jgi:hypothetical protein
MDKESVGGALLVGGIILLLSITIWKKGFKRFIKVQMVFDSMGEEGGTIFYYVISIGFIVIGLLLVTKLI